jgi:hypothetical protein
VMTTITLNADTNKLSIQKETKHKLAPVVLQSIVEIDVSNVINTKVILSEVLNALGDDIKFGFLTFDYIDEGERKNLGEW